MIEATCQKYQSFQEQIEFRDTVIFVTIPALLILQNLDDDDKDICMSFFPPMFGEEGTGCENMAVSEKQQTHDKYLNVKKDYMKFKKKADNEYEYYNLIEKSILDMEEDENLRKETEEELGENGMTREDLKQLVQKIRLLSMQLQRHKPTEWNEFLDVALDQEWPPSSEEVRYKLNLSKFG